MQCPIEITGCNLTDMVGEPLGEIGSRPLPNVSATSCIEAAVLDIADSMLVLASASRSTRAISSMIVARERRGPATIFEFMAAVLKKLPGKLLNV